jgi:hypothetical protein
MIVSNRCTSLTEAEIGRAKQIWHEYQQFHDVTALRGWAAGIDPQTGEVWVGQDLEQICNQRRKLGLTSPLFFERIGFRTYLRKLSPRRRRSSIR